MKRTFLRLSFSILASVFLVPFVMANPMGYAAMNGGTTGGAGGDVVYATTGTEIHVD